jgi:hypothetical protein
MKKAVVKKISPENKSSKKTKSPKVVKTKKTTSQKESLSVKTQFAIKLSVGVLLAITISLASLFYVKYNDLKNNPEQFQQQELNSVVSKVSKLIELPKNETPTVATVQDNNKLRDQEFFAEVENGDKVLIFTSSKKAIIYRESTNRIINVGPISIDSEEIN